MLINGAKLSYKTGTGSNYTDLVGCKEFPDLGGDPNKVDNSAVDDEYKQYENGQKDAGDIQFRFRYRTAAEKAQYTAMRALETAGTDINWKVTLFDGATMTFNGTAATRLMTGGGPDTPVDWQLTIGLSSDFDFTPAT
jgi:hypothetical protein